MQLMVQAFKGGNIDNPIPQTKSCRISRHIHILNTYPFLISKYSKLHRYYTTNQILLFQTYKCVCLELNKIVCDEKLNG